MSALGDGSQRVGHAERSAAIEALNEHWRAGRLDPAEHERRTTQAHAAVTRADLDVLFVDLPGEGSAAPAEWSARRPADRPGPSPRGGLFPAASWVGQHREALMALAPFVALVGYFALGREWQWFLLIPVMGVVLYAGERGGDEQRGGRRRGRHGSAEAGPDRREDRGPANPGA